jgi:hypothetical protein
MKKISALSVFLILNTLMASSQITWSNSIATIIYDNCATCHHTGGIAPFSLMTYDSVVYNAFNVQADVNASKMPPWPPDPNYSHFRNERVLSDAELSAINDWVNGGMLIGDTTFAPTPPVFNSNVVMQNPDDTLILPAFTLNANTDVYRCFAVHSNYTETKFLNEVEVIPGNSSIVHHLFLFHDSSDIAYQKDLADPLPGFYGGFLDGFSPYARCPQIWVLKFPRVPIL